jgi:hypothetical protein
VTAPDCTPAEDCLLLACDVAVRRALELASKRMLTRAYLAFQGLRDLPPYLMYLQLPAVTDAVRQDQLLRGAWTSLPEQLQAVDGLVEALDVYARGLVSTCARHDPELLRPIIREHL